MLLQDFETRRSIANATFSTFNFIQINLRNDLMYVSNEGTSKDHIKEWLDLYSASCCVLNKVNCEKLDHFGYYSRLIFQFM